MKTLFIILLCLMFMACTTQPGKSWLRQGADLTDYNPQNFQGCTVGEYIQPEGITVHWWDCKDKASVAGNVDLNADGTPDFSYTASDVRGSTAAEIRAGVEKAFSEAGVQVTPAIVDGVVNSLKTVIGVP